MKLWTSVGFSSLASIRRGITPWHLMSPLGGEGAHHVVLIRLQLFTITGSGADECFSMKCTDARRIDGFLPKTPIRRTPSPRHHEESSSVTSASADLHYVPRSSAAQGRGRYLSIYPHPTAVWVDGVWVCVHGKQNPSRHRYLPTGHHPSQPQPLSFTRPFELLRRTETLVCDKRSVGNICIYLCGCFVGGCVALGVVNDEVSSIACG